MSSILHEPEELPPVRPQRHPGRSGSSSLSGLSVSTQPLSFSRRRGSSFNGGLLAVPSPFSRLPDLAPSPAIPSPLSPGLLVITNDFPAPPKRSSGSQNSMGSTGSWQGCPAGKRQSLLPGALESLESLADCSNQSFDAGNMSYDGAGSPQKCQRTLPMSEGNWRMEATHPHGRSLSIKESPERMRGMLKREQSSESHHQNRASSRTGHEHKHRRSGTLASLATVATSGAQTVYEDALDGMSGDEADVEEGDTRESLGAQDERERPSTSTQVPIPKPLAATRAHPSRTTSASGKVRLSFTRLRSTSPMHSPNPSTTGSASSNESYSPISPLDPHLRTPSALSRQLSVSTSSRHERSKSDTSTGGDRRSGPRQLLLTPDVATRMSLAETSQRRESLFSQRDEEDEEHLEERHFALEEEMEALDRMDERALQRSQDDYYPYASLYREMAMSTNRLSVRQTDDETPPSSATSASTFIQPQPLSVVVEESYIETTEDEPSPRSFVVPARTSAGHPYGGGSSSAKSVSSMFLPENIPPVQPTWQRSRSLSNVNGDETRPFAKSIVPVAEGSSYASSLVSWSHTMASSLVTLETQNSAQDAVIRAGRPISLSLAPRPPRPAFVSRFTETGLDDMLEMLAQEPPKPSRNPRNGALSEGTGLIMQNSRERKGKAPQSLKSRASIWFNKPAADKTAGTPDGRRTVRAKQISAPSQARHIASGTLHPHVIRESPFGRRPVSPVQGYITVPHAMTAPEIDPVPSLPPLFMSPALSSVSSSQSDGPATPTMHNGPMRDFWAVSFAEAEAEQDAVVVVQDLGRKASRGGKMPISQSERERRRGSRRVGQGSRPGSRSCSVLLS